MDTHGQELAETFVKMVNTHDPDLVDQFMAEDYINHNAVVADGREANRQFWHAFFAALPDVSASMEDLVIAGDRMVGRFVYRGTHTGDFMGIPASGSAVEMRSIDIWRIEDGMFAEHWDELNTLQVFQQMGALPPLGGTGAQALSSCPSSPRSWAPAWSTAPTFSARSSSGRRSPGLTTPPSPRSWGTCTASQTAACPLQESWVSSQPPRLPVSLRQPTGPRPRRRRQRRSSSWRAG